MIKLNIIPQLLKKEIKLKLIYKYLKKLFRLLAISLFFYALLFLSSYFLLKQYFTENIQKKILTTNTTENYTQKVKEVNEQTKYIAQMQSDTVYWSQFLKYLSQNTNQDIKITKLVLTKSNNSLSLTGQAATRDSLLDFKTWLENSEYLDKVNLPIKNLLEKKEIDFNITAEIKSYEFN